MLNRVSARREHVAAVAVGHGDHRLRAPPASAAARGPRTPRPWPAGVSSASSSSRFSTKTWQRESSAPLSSNDGFSVVAPTSVTTPCSTNGRKPSCWARLKRWISSTNSSVAWPAGAAAAGGLERLLQVGDAGEHRRQLLELVAGLLGQQPRDGGLAGAGRAPEDHRGQPVRAGHAADRAVGPQQVVLAHHLVEGLRPQPVGQRARRLRRQAGGFEEVASWRQSVSQRTAWPENT